MKQISVIICSHNPRPAYLRETLDALKAQTLPKEQWELLLIDNASKQPLAQDWDLAWHSGARHIREEELGLTPARLRGIAEAQGEILVFVDDDVVLGTDYLEETLHIARQHGLIGAWSGQCIPRFEVDPPNWIKPYQECLTIRALSRPIWSNMGLEARDSLPWGAGLCVRADIAGIYSKRVNGDPKLRKLGRRGTELIACEDLDISMTACDQGYGTGVFPSLKLTHIIPEGRLRESYLIRLIEGTAYSLTLLRARRGIDLGCAPIKWYRKPFGHLRRWLTMKPIERRVSEARLRGQRRALEEIASRVVAGAAG